MKKLNYLSILTLLAVIFIPALSSCISVPKEVVTLSEVLGEDIRALRRAHLNFIEIYYNEKVKEIDSYLSKYHAPLLIKEFISQDVGLYNNEERKRESLLHDLQPLAKLTEGKLSSESKEVKDALAALGEFNEDLNTVVMETRTMLITPLLKQRQEVIDSINMSYENTVIANSTITGYLDSLVKARNIDDIIASLEKNFNLGDLLSKTEVFVSEIGKIGSKFINGDGNGLASLGKSWEKIVAEY